MTAAMAALAKGKKLSRKLSSGGEGKLTCWWQSGQSFTSMTVEPPSGGGESEGMQVVDVPRIATFGAVARAKTTEIAGSRGTLYIVAFVVTSDRYRILVNAGSKDRLDQAAGDAAVMMTELLHTS
ncbi:hypothetical protein [Nonomuraea typhae]|uniref:DUF3558 domain-containing protein n=1 Tax=Nonomuraea typhae TaxID=2603600 RepID=A0ABW7Z0V3_9ACTN